MLYHPKRSRHYESEHLLSDCFVHLFFSTQIFSLFVAQPERLTTAAVHLLISHGELALYVTTKLLFLVSLS